MEKYNELEMDVVLFATEDVVNDSNPETHEDEGGWF